VAVLATTNHPEKLDTAILDRPSRFDRKYYFELPGEPERRAYVQKWNGELQAELRFSGETVSIVVKKTEGFSFAYLKELFVASLAEWMSAEGKTPMDEVVLGQVKLLRGQTKRSKEGKGSKPDKKKEKKPGQ
jgi:SpoVK/Ycf46/Vps4 family AAA+-type ATPase